MGAKDTNPPGTAYAILGALLGYPVEPLLDALPEAQREVFVAHEIEGESMNDIARRTGVSVNTVLSRKHYAILHLRVRLQAIHDEFIQK